MFIASLFIQPGGGNKPNVDPLMTGKLVHPYNGVFSAIKRNEALIHAAKGMDLENGVPAERSQSRKATCYMIAFIQIVQVGKSIRT